MIKTVSVLASWLLIFVVLIELVAVNTITERIPALISYKVHDYLYRIKFSNAIMVDKEIYKGDQSLHYKP